MKWSPSRDEPGKWRLLRTKFETRHGLSTTTRSAFDEHIASVEKSDRASLFKEPAAYSAEVTTGPPGFGFRSAPGLFLSLKEAQLWCEQEIRLMEVGELA